MKYHSRSKGPCIVHVKTFSLPGNLAQTVLSSKKNEDRTAKWNH